MKEMGISLKKTPMMKMLLTSIIVSRKQLLACGTTATIEQRHESNDNFDHSNSDIEDSEPVSKKKRKAKKPKWKKCSLTKDEAVERFPWKNPPQNLDYDFSPYKLFEEFLTDEILSHICQESIRYTMSKRRENFTIDLHSLKGFVSILLISGYNALPRRSMYWQPTDDVYNAAVSSIMTRNRFDEIMQNLHLANDDDLDKNDKFAKVRPLINLLNKQCLEHFFPEQQISVNESMVSYYGKHGAKQYIHGKPIKFGYKMWVAATRLGYVIQLFPYQGAGIIHKELGLGGSVVDQLVSKLTKDDGICYHIIFDNFFTGTTLLCHLKERYGFAATGTIRSNRTGSVPLRDLNKMAKEKKGII